MPTTTCPQCQQSLADDELFCPHCGAAQIPQATKTQLAREQSAARATPRGAKVGCLIGLVVGAVLLVAVDPWLPPTGGAGDVALLVMPVVIGAVVGLVVQRVRKRHRGGSRNPGGGN
jgi:zinc-ribbon domain